MLYVEVLVSLAIAWFFWYIGHYHGKKWAHETKDHLDKKTQEAEEIIDRVNGQIISRITGIDGKLVETQDKIQALPQAADQMKEDSKIFVRSFNLMRDKLGGSIKDLKKFASTISLLEKNGFEMVVSRGKPEDREEIGPLPGKVFILFPKRTLLDRFIDIGGAGSAAVVANMVLDRLTGERKEMKANLDRIESHLLELRNRM